MKATPKKKTAFDHHSRDSRPRPGRAPRPKATEVRQVAALPFRRKASGAIEILLVTSRQTGRFIIPKGWPMKRLSDPDAAAKEAYEEAGVIGKVKRKPIGDYFYWKRLDRSIEFVKVDVYALEVRGQRADWPEKNARQSSWLSPKDAAAVVIEPGLTALLKSFAG